MAVVTITFSDIPDKEDGVNIQIVSDPPFDMQNDTGTSAQALGATMLELLNKHLAQDPNAEVNEIPDDEDCCGHEGCGCH